MCNHFRNHPEQLTTWREYAGFEMPVPDHAGDVWPKRKALVVRVVNDEKSLDAMTWGVPLETAGKRPGTTVKKHITNVCNLESPFWRATLVQPAQRCLVPFTAFAEPKPMLGGTKYGSRSRALLARRSQVSGDRRPQATYLPS